MKIEDVTGIGFTAGRATQQQAHLAIGNGLLRQIVINNQRMHAIVAEIFTHRAGCIRRQELHWCRIRRRGSHNNRIFQRTLLFQRAHNLRNRGPLLTNRNIDAEQFLAIIIASCRIHRLLVDEGIDRNGGLACLAVANDQFTLATTHRDQAVDCLQAGLHRLMNRFARHDAGGLDLDAAALDLFQRSLAVNRVTQRINNATKQSHANGCIHNSGCPTNDIAFLDGAVITENHDTDIVGFEVQGHTLHATLKFYHLTGLHFVKTVDTRDTVTNRQHPSYLCNLGVAAKICDLFLEDC